MKLKALLALIILLVCSCSESEPIQEISLKGTWKVVAYENHETGLVLTKTDANSDGGLDVIISFNDAVTPYVISGTNPPNEIYSTYSNLSCTAIQHADFFTTEICCSSEWGDYFMAATSGGLTEYDLSENTLRMYYSDMINSVLFEKVE
jgi:hypothetical protein